MLLRQADILDRETGFHLQHSSVSSCRLHRHDFMEIFVVVAGEVVHVLENETVRLHEGAAVFIRPFDAHTMNSAEQDVAAPAHYVNLAFAPETFAEIGAFLGLTERFCVLQRASRPPMARIDPQEGRAFAEALKKVRKTTLTDRTRLRAALRALLAQALLDWFSGFPGDADMAPPEWLMRLCRHMAEADHWRRGVPYLLQKACRTQEHVARSFRKWLGKTPTAFVNELRLCHAVEQLSATDDKIDQIAYDSGFANLSHFHHVFKQQFNMSPGIYRKRSRATTLPQ